MNLKIEDIAFAVLALIVLILLIKEVIPDHIKKYWGYVWQNRKDYKAGKPRRWIFIFKR